MTYEMMTSGQKETRFFARLSVLSVLNPESIARESQKAHDWAVEQLADLCHTTHRVTTQQVAKSRGQSCDDIELAAYLAKRRVRCLLPLVIDLRITHDRFGSSSDPSLNGHLHYPNDLDGPLNEAVTDKIHQYRADYNNRPSNGPSQSSTHHLCELQPSCR